MKSNLIVLLAYMTHSDGAEIEVDPNASEDTAELLKKFKIWFADRMMEREGKVHITSSVDTLTRDISFICSVLTKQEYQIVLNEQPKDFLVLLPILLVMFTKDIHELVKVPRNK